MKIVITGATGQVGNALGQKLVEAGHEVRVLVRDRQAATERLSFPAAIYAWDQATDALRDAEALVHLAGENIAGRRWTEKRKAALRDSRIQTANDLERAVKAAQAKLKVMITASAVGIYGDRGDEPLSEPSAAGGDFLSRLCVEWEESSVKIPADRFVALRFGVVLAKAGGFLSQVVPLFRMTGASVLGDGRQYFSWIHLEDLVHVIAEAIDPAKQMKGVYNATAPNPVTNRELTEQLAKVLGARSLPAAPKFALKLLYGELSQALLNSQRALPKRLHQENFKFRFATLQSALADIYPKMAPGEMQSLFEVWVNAPIDQVWDFFSSEKNLERLTPPMLNFHVVDKSTPDVQSGTIINYRLKIHGVPARWQTLIGDWQPPNRFSDNQVRGPYSKWYHEHEFIPLGKGVLMRDTVHWRLPFGQLGRMAALPSVLKDVEKIFTYRAKIIGQIFSPR